MLPVVLSNGFPVKRTNPLKGLAKWAIQTTLEVPEEVSHYHHGIRGRFTRKTRRPVSTHRKNLSGKGQSLSFFPSLEKPATFGMAKKMVSLS